MSCDSLNMTFFYTIELHKPRLYNEQVFVIVLPLPTYNYLIL
jgi:hypothetical protein